ncbi:MAG: UDP-N-acetylglucosamine acyltransferase [Gammaproteobacteria bacterium]
MIHPSSVIDPGSQLGEQVEIGPFAVIGAGVEIGDRTVIGSHTVLEGPTRIGCDNIIAPFCSLGGPPQDKKYAGEETTLVIGDRNTVREYCTFNRGTVQGGGTTEIGNDNWIMAYVHLAHDCVIGSNVVFANGATLAGHVTVGDGTTLGAFTVVHQFCAIGQSAFTAMGTVVFKDIPPFVTASGNTASPHGINTEGLRRAGLSQEAIMDLRRAYKVLYKKGLTVERAKEELQGDYEGKADIEALVEFVTSSARGIIR